MIDKIIRLVLGVVLIALALMVGNVLGYIGIIPIVIPLMSWCPLYTLLGKSSSVVTSALNKIKRL